MTGVYFTFLAPEVTSADFRLTHDDGNDQLTLTVVGSGVNFDNGTVVVSNSTNDKLAEDTFTAGTSAVMTGVPYAQINTVSVTLSLGSSTDCGGTIATNTQLDINQADGIFVPTTFLAGKFHICSLLFSQENCF